MFDVLSQLSLFAAKSFLVLIVIVLILIVFFVLLSKGKDRSKEKLTIKDLNEKLDEQSEEILHKTLNKKEMKKFHKEKKAAHKAAEKAPRKTLYILNFHGDIKASAVTGLSHELNAILKVATPNDEILVKIDSAGGMVHTYGLAAAQLMRIRAKNIPLTVAIDKIAASGGYLMACVANKIIAAPFAIIGSIGVVVQLPNFHKLLKEHHIDYEMYTAGEFKRTLTVFGENTAEGRKKLKEEIEEVHQIFKNLITDHRPQVDIDKVATGEHWLGQQALDLKLVDDIQTSDDYLLEKSKSAKLLEICYEVKKPMLSKLTSAAHSLREKIYTRYFY